MVCLAGYFPAKTSHPFLHSEVSDPALQGLNELRKECFAPPRMVQSQFVPDRCVPVRYIPYNGEMGGRAKFCWDMLGVGCRGRISGGHKEMSSILADK